MKIPEWSCETIMVVPFPEEIDEIIVTSLPSQSIQASIPVKKLGPTIINSNNNNDDNNSSDGITIEDNLNGESLDRNQAKQSETQQLASRVSNKLNSPTSKTLSVAVPPLIAHTRALNNINIDKTTTTATPVIEYRDLLSEFGLLDSDGTESCPDSNNSSEYYDKQLLSISEDSISDSNVKQSSHIISINNNNNESKDNLTGKGERSAEVEAKKISGSWPGIDYANKIIISNTGSHKTDDKLLLSSSGNSSSLPASLDCRKDYKNSEIVQPNKLSNYGFDKTINSKCTVNDVKCCCKPPRQVNDTNCKNNSSPMSRRCRSSTNSLTKSKLSASRTEEETTDADYDDVFIDDKVNLRLQFIDTTARSAPVTPTDEKSLPFSKLFRKKYPLSSSCSNSCNLNARMTDAILVRVSSLPDQDLLDITNDKNNHHHHHHHHQEFNRHPMKKKRRAISPLTLRSDITAKRLSESDKDVSQISPVQLKTFFPLNNNGHNDVAVGCDLPSGRKNSSDTSIESGKSDKFVKNEFRKAPNDDSSRSVSPMETFNCSNMATQTSPAISRSSSFTWVSDCDSPRDESALDLAASPQDTVDDDNRSSSSSQDLVQSLDEISSGSTSPDNTDRASPLESGIGTASPPRSTDRRSIKPLINNKCCRKETWERIRRRPSKLNSRSDKNSTDVWVRRESVYTQTRNQDKGSQEAVDSSSGVDDTLPRTKLSRPKDLIIDISSSLSSGEMLESLEISSPNSHIQPTEEPAENTDNQEAQIPPLHFQPDYQLSDIR
ncbi:Protein of unknown function [Cotesia congregata]|uniref:Uncharacterized protein n=1 Tax=Cotesia congregata TaxID=51543 RepID=A0A8J2HCC4_COTCN|nr:Protein of unknown function [Cotesia congregata]